MKSIRESWTIETTARGAIVLAAVVAGLSLVLAGPVAAQLPGTVYGQIFDAHTGDTLEGVQIIFTDPEAPSFRAEHLSGKNGRFRIMLKNVVKHERSGFSVELKKEGYVTRRVGNVRIPARQETRLSQLSGGGDWNLTSIENAQQAQAALGGDLGAAPEIDLEAQARGSAIKLYNQGSNALNSGDYDTAELMFVNALEKKADLVSAMGGLARVYSHRGDHVRAVEYAEKVAAEGEDLENMHQILYAGYDALGMDDKAETALKALQASDMGKAGKNMFNKAADLFNSGQIPEAQVELEKLLAADPNHPEANYMLGICYAGSDPAKAKVQFEKFLQLAPDHADAPTAREMLQYLE
ncbi:MAG: tetratricopeptide repeat protein [Acidobacteria bacterium]|nr:tetratricopeptide repeat protein [Acidobacteriota bacterium]